MDLSLSSGCAERFALFLLAIDKLILPMSHSNI